MKIVVLEEKLKQNEAEINDIKLFISGFEKELKTKVSQDQFYWVIGVLMTIILGIFGVIYSKLTTIDDKSVSIQNDVSFIQGKIKGAEITNQ